jgi:hypothetical protein
MIGRKVGGHDIIFIECNSVELEQIAAGLELLHGEPEAGAMPALYSKEEREHGLQCGSALGELVCIKKEDAGRREIS